MLGIALEGGGAKGAFHIGALEACMEMGYYPPDAIAGTSIGAMNAAMVAQGDFAVAKELWENISGKDIFTPEDEKLISTNLNSINIDGLADMFSAVRELISDGGIDNTHIKAMIDKYIDEDRLMQSPIDYGIVTLVLPEFRAIEIFKEEMGKENIATYILGSAAFPGFQKVQMGESIFLDGGVYDNCPVNMLLERGCDKVIAVRTNAIGITRYDEDDKRVITIEPSEKLGSLMKFSPETSRHNIKLGYYDAMRVLMKLGGTRYYLTDLELEAESRLFDLPAVAVVEAALLLKISHRIEHRRLLFERVLPVLFDELELPRTAGYKDLLLAMVEHKATRCGVERLCLYTAQELFDKVVRIRPEGKQKPLDRAIDLILEGLAKK